MELDLLGLLPAIHRYARDKKRDKGLPREKRLMRQLKKYLKALKILDPYIRIEDVWSWQDLVDRLRDAVDRARWRPVGNTILSELREERQKRAIKEAELEKERARREKAEYLRKKEELESIPVAEAVPIVEAIPVHEPIIEEPIAEPIIEEPIIEEPIYENIPGQEKPKESEIVESIPKDYTGPLAGGEE